MSKEPVALGLSVLVLQWPKQWTWREAGHVQHPSVFTMSTFGFCFVHAKYSITTTYYILGSHVILFYRYFSSLTPVLHDFTLPKYNKKTNIFNPLFTATCKHYAPLWFNL